MSKKQKTGPKKLTERLKIFLVLFLITSFSTATFASPGKYIELNAGAKIPWHGWCFDEEAMAKIIANKELETSRCQIKIDEAIEKKTADFDLRIGNLQAKLDYEINTKQATIDALSAQNTKLEETIIHSSKYDWITYGSVGFTIGVLTTLVVGVLVIND